jgi:RecA/RadA recombinase
MTSYLGVSEKLPTGAANIDELIGGGLRTCCVTDVFGAAATGKTQFAFQNALFVAKRSLSEYSGDKPAVVFVDCAGSFRPERIADMADARNELAAINGQQGDIKPPSDILSRISTVYVRSVADQKEASELLLTAGKFSKCKLIIVDDVTTNFVAEFSGVDIEGESAKEIDNSYASLELELPDFVGRHFELSMYGRKLAYIALKMNLSVLLTNSIRSRIPTEDKNEASNRNEGETTGEILSQFCLFRLHFSRKSNFRNAELDYPIRSFNRNARFRIEREGIIPSLDHK